MIQQNLFDALPPIVEGFNYFDDVMTEAEEQAYIISLEALTFNPVEFHGNVGRRRMTSFGWNYDLQRRTLARAEPMPPFLQNLRNLAADFAGIDANDLKQAIINEYSSGAGVGWHRDKEVFKDIVGVSFGAPCVFRLRPKERGLQRPVSLTLEPRSLYIMKDSAREEWEHSVRAVDRLRYSVTFRNFKAEFRSKYRD